ncbi:MAG: ABC transporter permease [Ardenticatenaceae bacterium]|nr:ABC transporter permease [Anaerolineales bacterium]MCB8985253.1 ABC transporter permease [Ardenticatenaceae bacterium]MCB8988007.1 ABC transporter permease [Ardenticatenaceae bacterium]
MPALLSETFLYAQSHVAELLNALGEHLLLVAVSLGISMLVSIPLGIWTSRSRTASLTVINTFNALRVIPSIAILFLAIPVFGLSNVSAIIALTILAFPPILINTNAAYRTIEPAIRESAFGMGMTSKQSLWRVETPLALPVIVAGVRTAAVEVIASATLAAFIGIGGLGLFVVRGFALYDIPILLVGAVPVALLALTADLLLGALQNRLQPPS